MASALRPFVEAGDASNNFHIRHLETNRQPVTERAHVDYLFRRMLALLQVLLRPPTHSDCHSAPRLIGLATAVMACTFKSIEVEVCRQVLGLRSAGSAFTRNIGIRPEPDIV